jgi:ankyrin repeat protein
MLLTRAAWVDAVDANGYTCLTHAAVMKHTAVVKLLLKAGADAMTAVTAMSNVLEGVYHAASWRLRCDEGVAHLHI